MRDIRRVSFKLGGYGVSYRNSHASNRGNAGLDRLLAPGHTRSLPDCPAIGSPSKLTSSMPSRIFRSPDASARRRSQPVALHGLRMGNVQPDSSLFHVFVP